MYASYRLTALVAMGLGGCVHTPVVHSQAAPSQPACIQISLDRIWSTDMAVGSIDFESEHVFAVSFDARRWLGWPNPADNIRLGGSWESGSKAISYELGDFNRDGVQDVLIVFRTAQLAASGNLTKNTLELTVWARDEKTGELVCAKGKLEDVSD